MKQIWKYKLNLQDEIFVEIPKDGEILSVQTQKGEPCMWVLVNPESEKEKRCFEIFGTGNPITSDMDVNTKFIGTFQLYGGDLVFHLFERKLNNNTNKDE